MPLLSAAAIILNWKKKEKKKHLFTYIWDTLTNKNKKKQFKQAYVAQQRCEHIAL